MSVKSEPYYWVECDNCGTRCEYGDYAAFVHPDSAVDGAIDSGWTTIAGRYHCPRCPPLQNCDDCGATVNDPLFGERDYLCETCWAKAEAAS